MSQQWRNKVDLFLKLANKHDVRMILVGGGAVNFHGYQRHSADVGFWIDTSTKNLEKSIKVFGEMGYGIDDFPEEVKSKQQNISVKFSSTDLNLELITRFSLSKTFEEAYENSLLATHDNLKDVNWRVLSYKDLIDSKMKAKRPKDLLDVQQLKEINNNKDE